VVLAGMIFLRVVCARDERGGFDGLRDEHQRREKRRNGMRFHDPAFPVRRPDRAALGRGFRGGNSRSFGSLFGRSECLLLPPPHTGTHGIGKFSSVVVHVPPDATTTEPKRSSTLPCDMQTSGWGSLAALFFLIAAFVV
jgi:hypothetical protein